MNHYHKANRIRSRQRWAIAGACTTTLALFSPMFQTAIGSASTSLDKPTQQAMIDAINDEYQARTLYAAVINKFGRVRPFSNIVTAEDRHVMLWNDLFTRYGLPIPEDKFAGAVEAPETLEAACQMGVTAEIANVEMYDHFLTFVKEPDLRAAFTQLRHVSQENHLPAFQRCLDRQATGGGNRRNSVR
ncbi:ferritin-like domain-containing protein [Leptothermofonsia sp. ETS-13]|uniref:ferritin-like domain-containing protein n=1 Tax=Leptothermofonsia sp. ETS-13 TaxID=3035696 RepID=UPI003BA23938